MAGTYPVDGNLSMADLAAKLTAKERTEFLRLTGLTADSIRIRNLATFVIESYRQGNVAIVAAGAASRGTLLLSSPIYIGGAKIRVDVYRLTEYRTPEQAQVAADVRTVYAKIAAALTDPYAGRGIAPENVLRRILTAAGYAPRADEGGAALLEDLREAMADAHNDEKKLARLGQAVAEALRK